MRVPLGQVTMATDQAKRIAERVARRLAGESNPPAPPASPARNGAGSASEQPRARIIDFISPGPPVRSASSIGSSVPGIRNESPISPSQELRAPESILTASPWHGRLSSMLGQHAHASSPQIQPANHPSEERFGIEEATVTELVEFFEKEKQCAMDPSGKPCDHCAMCNSRGF